MEASQSIDKLHTPHVLGHLLQELCEAQRLEVVVLEAVVGTISTIAIHVLELAGQHVLERRLEGVQVSLSHGEVVGGEVGVDERGAVVAVSHGVVEGGRQRSRGAGSEEGSRTVLVVDVVFFQEVGEQVKLVGLEGVEGEGGKVTVG